MNNPQAFPNGLKAMNIGSNGGRYEGTYVDEYASADGGMTLRDYFAAKAMQAAATNPVGADGFTFEERAQWAYQQADAMLKAREA